MPLFIASLYGVYFTPLFDALMRNPVGHQVMLAHFVVIGLLFFGPIVGQDPWPRTLSHPARMLELFLPVPFHAFFGVSIMMAGSLVVTTFTSPPAGWGIDPLRRSGRAGGIVWAFGELPTVLVLAVVFFSWASSEERRARAIDRTADRTHDAELAAYNARLRAMAEQQPAETYDRPRPMRSGRSSGPRQPAWTTASSGQVLLGRLDQHRRHERPEHQQHRCPGERRRVALDLGLQPDGRVLPGRRRRPPRR